MIGYLLKGALGSVAAAVALAGGTAAHTPMAVASPPPPTVFNPFTLTGGSSGGTTATATVTKVPSDAVLRAAVLIAEEPKERSPHKPPHDHDHDDHDQGHKDK